MLKKTSLLLIIISLLTAKSFAISPCDNLAKLWVGKFTFNASRIYEKDCTYTLRINAENLGNEQVKLSLDFSNPNHSRWSCKKHLYWTMIGKCAVNGSLSFPQSCMAGTVGNSLMSLFMTSAYCHGATGQGELISAS